MIDMLGHNLLAWMLQTTLLASAGAVLPLLFRLRHPRTQLAYCHLLLGACLLLPVVEPWSHPRLAVPVPGPVETLPVGAPSAGAGVSVPGDARPEGAAKPAPPAAPATTSPFLRWARLTDARALLWILSAGALARICWLLAGLWQIRRYRIGATPLYPLPESVGAAAAVAHTDALFCMSPQISGPVMLGWLAPVVLLPECFLTLDEEAQCGIACHELLHVRRADWVVTLLEELLVSLLWFNPAAWMLLARARLVREELVDAETVRLTSAREPYIDALLAIARHRQTLELAPASLFLRRRHLTQRMHSLLKEVSVSRSRLLFSYGFICAMLAFAGWFACLSFPLIGEPQLFAAPASSPGPQMAVEAAPGAPQVTPQAAPQDTPAEPAKDRQTIVAFEAPQGRTMRFNNAPTRLPSAPIPPDPQEPVIGSAQNASDPEARAAALSLVERARANGLTHRPGTPPYRLEAAFSAGGSAAYAGPGQLTETWLNGQRWRWTATLGNYSVVRVPGAGTASGETNPGAVPMSVHELRNAIFWAIPSIPSGFLIRTAAIQWNGRPATCILTSGMVAATEQTRLWEEEEYCIDSASGVIQVHSIAPGVYTVYGYDKSQQFHGLATPDRITIYANGAKTLDAQVTLADAGAVNESELVATPEMLAAGPVATLFLPMRFAINVPSASVSGMVKPVMVHASVDRSGKVTEEELLAASDPALVQAARELVKNTTFQADGTQRQMYINVRYVPAP
jgi:beta-lactamase regulating signal transducer with metallopeptidase domain